MRSLILILTAACSSSAPSAVSTWPPGSKITPNTCFERETENGWVPVQVHDADGGLPIRQQQVNGNWYFPMDAGALRLRPCE